jgi:hypothetical protein
VGGIPRQRGSRPSRCLDADGPWRNEGAAQWRRRGDTTARRLERSQGQLAQGRLRALPPEETIEADQTREPKTLTLPLLSVIDD